MASRECFDEIMAAPLQLSIDDSTLVERYVVATRESLLIGPYESDWDDTMTEYARHAIDTALRDPLFMYEAQRSETIGAMLLLMSYNTATDEAAVFAAYDGLQNSR